MEVRVPLLTAFTREHPISGPIIAILFVLLAAGPAFCDLQRPDMKALAAPMYFPESGIQLSTSVANDIDYLNPSMLRVEFIGEGDATNSIRYPAYDYLADTAGERGIPLLGLIDYASIDWESRDEWATQEFRDRFTTRVQEIVTHFHDRQYPIKHWEIWNEPDIALPEFNVRIDPEPYAKLLIQSYDAIKAIDPDATVVFGGISPKGFEYAENYLEDVYQTQDMADYFQGNGHYPFDVVAAHPYPEVFTNPNPGLATVLNNEIKAVMNDFGDSDKKVWLTEMGWSSYYVSEQAQAFYLRESFELVDTLTDPENPNDPPYVEKYFWFYYKDFSAVDKWGLYTQDLSRQKPAYDEYLGLTPTGPVPSDPTPDTGQNPPVWEGNTDADLTYQVSGSDLIESMTGQIISGGFHPANAGSVAKLSNGLFDSNGVTLVLADYESPALRVRYTFPQPMDIEEVRIFAGHNGDGGNRAFQSNDIWINGEPAATELNTGNYEQKSGGSKAVSLVRWLPEEGNGFAARYVETLDVFMFCSSSLSGDFRDRWSPLDDPEKDKDGLGPAFVAPIIKEIDVLGRQSPEIESGNWMVY